MVFLVEALDAELVTLSFIFFFLFLSLLLRFHRKPYPPGPKGWPVIGNMELMNHYSHRGLAKLAQQYGGLLHFKMGSVHMVVVSGPEEARQVLQVQDHVFSNRPATIAISYLTYDRADMVFAHYGPFWRQMRKVCVKKLLGRRRAESWYSVRDEVDKMVRAVAESATAGSAVNICDLVNGLARDITYRAAFGSSVDDGKDEFVNIMREFSYLFGAFNIADFFPWLKWADPHGLNHRLATARASLDFFIDNIIKNHMQKRKAKNEEISGEGDDDDKDMVDELLNFYSEEAAVNESEDLQNAIKLTRDNIKAVIMDVMFGGTETIATSIEWALAELMKSPENLKRVQNELAVVVGLDRKVEETDFDNLTFLKCCLKETLRLHAPIPLLLHQTAEATEVDGYYIPAKSRVLINAWAIGRDKNHWKDPESFKPDRFLKPGAPDFKGNNFEFLPFGSGRRSCPGMQLGVYAVEMAVAHLLHCFTWELADGMKASELKMDDAFGLKAPLANPLLLVPTLRLLEKNLN